MSVSLPRSHAAELGSQYCIYLDGSRPNETDYDITTSLTDEGLRIEGPMAGVLEVIASMGHVAGRHSTKFDDSMDNLAEGLHDAAFSYNGDTDQVTVLLPHFTVE